MTDWLQWVAFFLSFVFLKIFFVVVVVAKNISLHKSFRDRVAMAFAHQCAAHSQQDVNKFHFEYALNANRRGGRAWDFSFSFRQPFNLSLNEWKKKQQQNDIRFGAKQNKTVTANHFYSRKSHLKTDLKFHVKWLLHLCCDRCANDGENVHTARYDSRDVMPTMLSSIHCFAFGFKWQQARCSAVS